MSKFFRYAASSESESESEVGEEVPVRAPAPVRPVSFFPSDDEEDTKRVVRTAKDKRFSELKDLIKQLRNSKKIKDMSKVLTIFEDLCVAYQKSKNVIEKEGGFAPRFYLRYLYELDEFINANWEDKEAKKNLSKNNAKSLSTIRQKYRKYGKDFEAEVDEYRQDPDPEGYSSEEELESEDELEEESEIVTKQPLVKEKSKFMKKSDDEDSDWEMSSSSDESEEEFGGKTMEELRKYFLKSTVTKPAKEKEKRRVRVDRDRKEVDEDKDDDAGWKSVAGVPAKIEMFPKDAEITHDAVLKKLNEILAARGRKGTDRRELVDLLKELHSIATSNNLCMGLCLKILFAVIASSFDYTKYMDCLSYTTFRSIFPIINQVLEILKANHQIRCSSLIPEEQENLADPSRLIQIQACILTMFERLDEEFSKLLQEADCHSNDYIDKLKSETDICALIDDLKGYLESIDASNDELCRIYMRKIEHLYYKFDANDSNREMIENLCKFVYAKDDRRLRARAMLCNIYHHALHGRWHEARDLMLISHLQATIDNSDISSQILYNRAVCQLGLCAFKNGLIQEAFNALTDFQGGGKIKELLAQGLSMVPKGQERSAEQEKLERQRQLPYHMHINLDLLESVYLISAMLLEIPQIAARDLDGRRGFRISRSFHYQLKQSERQSLIGQPENTREHVIAASRALLRGDWRACRDYVINEKMNAKVWNLFINSDKVKTMLVRRIQEEALRTYMFTYSSIYDSVSLVKLGEMFELDKKAVHSLISKMIIQVDLSASLDEPAEIVVIHRVEPTRLQALGLQLTDKLKALAESLDQVLEPRTSNYAYKQNWYGQRQQGGQQQEGGRRQQQQKAF